MNLDSVNQIVSKYEICIDSSYEVIKFDRYDFLMSAFSGVTAGIIDIFAVGIPKTGPLTKLADKQVDNMVLKFAKLVGWKPKSGKENSVASAIGFLEKKYKVNYDHRSTTDVSGKFPLGTTNHHIKSLSHSPDPIGLFFSLLDQFTNTASFVHDGKLIRIQTDGYSLQGSNLLAKIFCGFVNWIGHIMSDIAGSSGGRGNNSGRGTGVPIPFMALFQFLNVGSFSVGKFKNNFAEVMVKVFQEGYDFRHGLAMAVPVAVNELLTRVLWAIKRKFYYNLPWSECIPSSNDKVLRLMLLISTGTLCVMDGIDALIRGWGNAVTICLRMNYIAWLRLLFLVGKELQAYLGPILFKYLTDIVDLSKQAIMPGAEQERILAFYADLSQYQGSLTEKLRLFCDELDKDLKIKESLLQDIYSSENIEIRINSSVKYARVNGVSEKYILKNIEDLDRLFINSDGVNNESD